MEYFGIHWQIGRPWGNHHPDHNCWNAPESVVYKDNVLQLGVDYKPKVFELPDPNNPGQTYKKRYPWSVGYVTSTDFFKYGYFRFDFKLPLGRHLWPAIWLSDRDTWPPEIDAVEGWSGQYNWPFKPESADRIYRINPFANRIFPSLHLGTNPEEYRVKSYKKLNGTCPSYLNITSNNTCELIWAPDRIRIYYDGRLVMDESSPEVLKYYNESNGMKIILNNYVTNKFNIDDYIHMNDRKDMCKWFYIYNVDYNTDYEFITEPK